MSIDILSKRELGTNISSPLIRLVSRKERKNESDKLSSSKGEGAFMMMSPSLFIFFPVISREYRVIFSDEVSCFCEIIAEILVSRARHFSILSPELTGLFFWPDISGQFSQLIMGREFSNISYFGDYTCCKDRTYSWDRGKGLGKGSEFGGDSFIYLLKEGSESAESIDLMREDEINGSGEFRTETIGFSYGRLDNLSYLRRLGISVFAFFYYDIFEFLERHRSDFFLRERGEDGREGFSCNTGRLILKYSGSLEEDVTEEGVGFANNIFNQMESVASKDSEGVVRVGGDMRERESGRDAKIMSQDFGIYSVSFIKFGQRFSESIDSQSIESIYFHFTGRRFSLLSKEVSQVPVINTCGLGSKFKGRNVLFFKEDLLDSFKELLSTFRGVGERKGFTESGTILIHYTGDNLPQVNVQTNIKGIHAFTSFPREEGDKEGESWWPGYRAASRMSTQRVRCSVSSLYPGPGGQTSTSTLKCLEGKSTPELPPSEVIITRILPLLQYLGGFFFIMMGKHIIRGRKR